MRQRDSKGKFVAENMQDRKCKHCTSNTTYASKKTGYPVWYKSEGDGWLCERCYGILIRNPKYGPRRMKFKDTIIHLSQNPRTGICHDCGRATETDIHHYAEYDEQDPLKNTIELCPSCHCRESWKLGQMNPIKSK